MLQSTASYRKYALTAQTWEHQRDAYLAHADTLNPEFEQYRAKIAQATKPVPNVQRFTFGAMHTPAISRKPLRLPHTCQSITIVAGRAWVTYRSKDYMLTEGQQLHFEVAGDAVISSMGHTALIFDAVL